MASADGRWTAVLQRRDLQLPGPCAASWKAPASGAGAAPPTPRSCSPPSSRWGLDATLPRLVGMFAFALWDGRERCLYLARDRMGEKPLYYGWSGGAFLFGSELKALRAFPHWQGEIDRDVLALYLRYGYVPEPYAIYRGIRKLPPGTLAADCRRAGGAASPATPQAYWSAPAAADARRQADRFAGSPQDALTRLDALLREAVAGQMVADVPLGAFLSGGIDSSLIVALMQAQSSQPGAHLHHRLHRGGVQRGAPCARRSRRTSGTRSHRALRLAARDALAVIPTLPSIYDEPFGDSSQIPTILVSRMARAPRDGLPLRRRRRRAVRRLHAVRPGRAAVAAVGRVPAPLRQVLATLVPPVNDRAVKLARGARRRRSARALPPADLPVPRAAAPGARSRRAADHPHRSRPAGRSWPITATR